MGTLHATFGSKQTYYCYEEPDKAKKTLFVTVTIAMTESHADACVELCRESCKRGLNKADTVAFRAEILKNYE